MKKFISGLVAIVMTISFILPSTLAFNQQDYQTKFENVSNFVLESAQPTQAITWSIIGLSRTDKVENNSQLVQDYIKNRIDSITNSNGNFSSVTDLEKEIISLGSVGVDVQNINGINLIEKLLNYPNLENQAITGLVYALIAINTNDFNIEGFQTNEQQILDALIAKELTNGGFAFFGSKADSDITAMALQALAPYKEIPKVNELIERTLTTLQSLVGDNGGILNYEPKEVVESTAQTLIALTSLGIDPTVDERFIKNGNNMIDFILSCVKDNGGVSSFPTGSSNGFAVDQSFLGLSAYNCFLKDGTSLYDYRQKEVTPPVEPPVVDPEPPTEDIKPDENLVCNFDNSLLNQNFDINIPNYILTLEENIQYILFPQTTLPSGYSVKFKILDTLKTLKTYNLGDYIPVKNGQILVMSLTDNTGATTEYEFSIIKKVNEVVPPTVENNNNNNNNNNPNITNPPTGDFSFPILFLGITLISGLCLILTNKKAVK